MKTPKITFPDPAAKSPLIDWNTAKQLLVIHKERNKNRVHSMQGGGWIPMGCDVDLKDVAKDAKTYGISISGPNMRRMDHGLAIVKEGRATFYATPHRLQSALTEAADKWKALRG